jgi:4'-phosphopantetheinyl transferase
MLSLAPDEVHVWTARPSALDEASPRAWTQNASDEERLRSQNFRFDRHRREHLATRALVRTALSRYRDVEPRAWRWRLGEHGRPYVDPPCGLWFNAANHPDFVVCAVATHEDVGIDVEPVSRAEEILEVAATVFAPVELDDLARRTGDARRDRAVTLWTGKEAYIKARGLGFAAPVREIVMDDLPGWSLAWRDVEGFRIATAVKCLAGPPRIELRAIDP